MPTLREIRDLRALSIQELSTAAGVSKSAILDAELARRRPIGRTRRKLAKALKVRVESIDWPPGR